MIDQIRVIRRFSSQSRGNLRFQLLRALPQPRVSSPMHALWPLRERAIKRSIPAKAEPQLASLEMPTTFRALGLARVGRITGAGSTTIASEPIKQLRHAPFAIRAMQHGRSPQPKWQRVHETRICCGILRGISSSSAYRSARILVISGQRSADQLYRLSPNSPKRCRTPTSKQSPLNFSIVVLSALLPRRSRSSR